MGIKSFIKTSLIFPITQLHFIVYNNNDFLGVTFLQATVPRLYSPLTKYY